MKYFLGVDNGGTMAKAALYDEKGREIAVASRASGLLTPAQGFTERDMDAMWADTATCIREAVEASGISPKQIAAVACTGHGKGLYLWGQNGAPVRNGIISTDTRAGALVAQWYADGTAERVYPKTMQQILVCQPCALLRWLKEHEPENYGQIRWVFEAKDYIRFRLTGQAHGELTDYSGTSLVNLHTRAYDPDLLEAFGIPEIGDALPPLVKSSDLCGAVTAEAAALTGLRAGTPVAGGMFDIDACAIATGLVDETDLCVIAGTWSINEYIARKPVTGGNIAMNSLFCMPEYYLIEESSPTSAGNLEWYVKNVLDCDRAAAKSAGLNFYALLDNGVEAIGPEEDVPVFLPFLYGSPDNPDATASFTGISARHTKAHLARAIFEGVVFRHHDHIAKLLANREQPGCLRLSGGAAGSRVWAQMFADVMQIPVETAPVKEPGTLGCAIAGAVAAGVYESYADAARNMAPAGLRITPDPAKAEVYQRKLARYHRVERALSETWGK